LILCRQPWRAGHPVEYAESDQKPTTAVSVNISARGDLPFLHAWKTNTAADTIYESLGFVRRADVNVAELGKRSTMENAAANIGF
jgi:hypothetical protein